MSADKKKKTGNTPNSTIAGEEDEFAYLEKKLGISRQRIKDAIKAVGRDRKKVEQYLAGK